MSESDKIVQRAKDRLDEAMSWERTTRNLFVQDLRFDAADSDNHFQWPDEIFKPRDIENRPALTINKTQQHNWIIINDIAKHRPAVKIRAVGGDASYESAQIFDSIIKHIEYQSNAANAYDIATGFQVRGGMGYWRVVTDYCDDKSFDQDIFIRPIPDPLMVLLDPNIQEKDGSDARWGLIFQDIPKDLFDKRYPQYKDVAGSNVLGAGGDWFTKNTIRIAEYYEKTEKEDTLILLNGNVVRKSLLPPEAWSGTDTEPGLKDNPEVRTRPITTQNIMWYMIVGDKIAKRTPWLGKYIPIVRVPGIESVIAGQLDRKGHTRALKDPQRIYNYWSSAAVEMVALQGKTPWIAPVDAIEELETYWATANRVNHAVLPYNPFDDEGRELPPPTRAQPPTMAPAYISGMQIAQGEMQMVSGQYSSIMGQESNERTGIAIEARQDQGETATSHFKNNLGMAIRFTGKILVDLVPKIYDTERVIRVMAEDGTEMEVTVDPTASAPVGTPPMPSAGAPPPIGQPTPGGVPGAPPAPPLPMPSGPNPAELVKRIFNPNVGKYDVVSDSGPDFGTRRQEAKEALTNVLTQAPNLVPIVGDLLFKMSDFPLSLEIAQRLKRLVPPQALGQGPSQQEQILSQQLTEAQALIQQLQDEYTKKDIALKGKVEKREVDVYKAESERLKVLLTAIPEEALTPVIQQMIQDLLDSGLQGVTGANADDLALMQNDAGPAPPIPGARRAPDGNHYLPDPTRPGKFLRVDRGGQ